LGTFGGVQGSVWNDPLRGFWKIPRRANSRRSLMRLAQSLKWKGRSWIMVRFGSDGQPVSCHPSVSRLLTSIQPRFINNLELLAPPIWSEADRIYFSTVRCGRICSIFVCATGVVVARMKETMSGRDQEQHRIAQAFKVSPRTKTLPTA
jgi:hypothetical protein